MEGHGRVLVAAPGRSARARLRLELPRAGAGLRALRDHLAVYPAAMEACFVGGERVRPQPGGFYGGWITGNLVGPFKGGPGSAGW